MAGRRVLYGLILVAVFLFQISNDNYLAPLLLTLTLALPVLSLLISLPSVLTCRLSLNALPAGLTRGNEAHWGIVPNFRVGLPLPRLTIQLEEKNLFTGTMVRKKLSLNGITQQTRTTLSAEVSHCGLLELRVKKLRVYDYLGLFAFPLPKPDPAQILVEPDPIDPGPLYVPDGWGVRPAPGSTLRRSLGEDYDLREYRPGDPLRSVHWKLSSKWDDLIVREPAESFVPLLLLTFDRFGTPERLDAVLDKLMGYSRALLTIQRPHAIRWFDTTGTAVLCEVSDEKELQECLWAILSFPAPIQPPASEPEWTDTPGTTSLCIHISLDEEVPE